jgi:hypothetical protein
MSIPLDRLYHYIENIAQNIYSDHVIIYRFWPHGSKKLENLEELVPRGWQERMLLPKIYCQDQEPLDYNFYLDNSTAANGVWNNVWDNEWDQLLDSLSLRMPTTNLYQGGQSVFEKSILIHSEQNSTELKKYQDISFVPVYYWSHAVIARDWFRYAQHETFDKHTKKLFLIYNRAWSGTREYRLKFTELLIQQGLIEQCKTSCNATDNDVHYSNHTFNNVIWKPTIVLENHAQPTHATSNYSADFDTKDYDSTDVEVVLETLFDDGRLHLTEKSLRPIACGQPFILTATAGSLKYLKSYGFKTFGSVWDESYDSIEDPQKRLQAIISVMKSITNWDTDTYNKKILEARQIADYNKQYFFSDAFFDQVIDELKQNLSVAFEQMHQANNFKFWIDRWEHLMSYPAINHWLAHSTDEDSPTKSQVEFVLHTAKQLFQARMITGSQSAPGDCA